MSNHYEIDIICSLTQEQIEGEIQKIPGVHETKNFIDRTQDDAEQYEPSDQSDWFKIPYSDSMYRIAREQPALLKRLLGSYALLSEDDWREQIEARITRVFGTRIFEYEDNWEHVPDYWYEEEDEDEEIPE